MSAHIKGIRLAALASLLATVWSAPPLDARPLPSAYRPPQAAQRGWLGPPVIDGDTFNYDYTTSLDERIQGKPFKELFKGSSTTTVQAFTQRVSGHAIQFEFVSASGDIGNSDRMGTLVNFTPAGSGTQSGADEVVWGYGLSADPTDSFQTAAPGFSTPYIVDTYPETAGAAWTSNGANLDEYTVQNFIRTSYYEDGFVDTRAAGETLRDDIDAVGSTSIGTNSEDRADGSGRMTTIPANAAASETTFGSPVQMGAAFVIPVTTRGKTTDVPDWFPGGGAPPQPITNDTFAIAAPVTTPHACGKMAGLMADDLHETVQTVSVTRGTVARRDTHYYDTTAGTVCRIETIEVDEYANTTSGKLIGTVKIATEARITGSTLVRRLVSGTGSTAPFRSDFTNQEFVPEVLFGPKLLY